MRRIFGLLIALALAAGALVPASGSANAAGGPVVGSYARVANYAFLRIRTGPGYDRDVITQMPKGAVFKVLSGPHNREWYKVTYRGTTGYSVDDYMVHTGLAGARIARKYRKVVVVSLARQQVEAYQNGKLVLVSAATTGRPELRTPTGATRVLAKLSPYRMVSPWPKDSPYYYDPVWMDYAIRYRSGGYYIHDAPWRPYYGYGTNRPHTDPDGVWRTGSHGCVNLPLWAEAKLYRWIGVGTAVQVVSW